MENDIIAHDDRVDIFAFFYHARSFSCLNCFLASQVQSLTWPVVFPRIDDSHCNRIHSSLTAVCCLDDSYVGKQQGVWKE